MALKTIELEARSRIEAGTSSAELVEWLHACGYSIIDSIRIIYHAAGIGLGEAKEIVSSHPVWEAVVQASIPLQEDGIAMLTKMAEDSFREDSPEE